MMVLVLMTMVLLLIVIVICLYMATSARIGTLEEVVTDMERRLYVLDEQVKSAKERMR